LSSTYAENRLPEGRARLQNSVTSPGDEYRLLVDGVQEYAMYLLDVQGRVATWNRGAERIEGYRADEIIGEHFSRFYQPHEVLAGKPVEELRIATETGRFEEEGWRVRKDGTPFWASVLITALRGANGELRGFGKLTRDLTDRKRAEETARELIREQAARSAAEEAESRLRASEERFRQLSRRLEVILEGVGDAITAQDPSGHLVFANSAAARSCGFATARDLMSSSVDQVVARFDLFDEQGAPFDAAKLPGQFAAAGLETEPVLVRVRERATAVERWALVRASPVRNERGEPELAVNIWNDVTSRRREEVADRALVRATEALSQTFDYEKALADMAATLVPELADWCSIDMLEEQEIKMVAVANVDPQKAAMARALRERYPFLGNSTGVGQVIREGRAQLFSEISDSAYERDVPDPEMRAGVRALDLRSLLIVPIKTRDGTLGAITLSTVTAGRRYDEHDLVLAEELGRRAGIAIENARLYRDSQRAIRLRDEFLSIAGHELKTPLTALDLQLQSLLAAFTRGTAAQQPDRWEDRLRKAISQSRRIGRLVHELLDVSRITSGRLVLEPEPLDMAHLVQEIIERHASELARAGSEISLEVEGRTTGAWDASRLDQVVSNVLSNAIKYGAGKSIDVRVKGNERVVTVSIHDRGIGIPPERQDKIFQRFERAVSDRNYGGLGLGLWIVREIVQAHGGKVGFESSPGTGSTFVIELPVSSP
jgi:PAS domain S-box-containing protein